MNWKYFKRDSPFNFVPSLVTVALISIEWKRILESVQEYFALNIWVSFAGSALLEPLYKWALPGTYARYVAQKKEEENTGDVEVGEQGGENKEPPLTGLGQEE
jgi:hypothetical protein